ncbi:hypothetical protein KEJ32_05550 [Candidatus Bathyarchaeota archaeon]|nr:hypothetical protein [Candidatus Bathyarchaeota archaeon]
MSPLQIKFLGATHEVGRAAISVKTEKTQVLLDYGVMLNHEPGFPSGRLHRQKQLPNGADVSQFGGLG